MEIENQKKPVLLRWYILLPLIIIILFITSYAWVSVKSPAKKLNELEETFRIVPDDKSKTDTRIYSDSTYLSLIHERSFLQSRIAMAESDSVYLTINLADSTANLEISGVVVHETPLMNIEISKILRKGDEYTITSLFSKPFNIISYYSTIEKEPLMIQIAPKDTSEYKPDIIPDTADVEPVNYVFELDYGIRLFVFQEEEINPGDRRSSDKINMHYRYKDTGEALKNYFSFNVPEYHPFIKVILPRADAKIIFRALPDRGQIAIYR